MLFSLIKSGQFFEHFEQLDFDEVKGPNGRYPPQTALLPDMAYIHEAVVYRAPDAKPWGADTYYGRIALYKSKSGQRIVINTPKTTAASLDPSNMDLDAYPGLPEIVGIVDRLSTYLFDGGFVPIVRAHSHAAIPLKMGGEIIKSLFDNESCAKEREVAAWQRRRPLEGFRTLLRHVSCQLCRKIRPRV